MNSVRELAKGRLKKIAKKNGADAIDKVTFGYLNGRPIWKLNLERVTILSILKKEIAEQGGTMKLSNRVLKNGRKCDFGCSS